MGFLDSHDSTTNSQDGINSSGSVIDIQQSGDIPTIFWIGFFCFIGGIAVFFCWRYNKSRNVKLRAKYPTAYRPDDESKEQSYGNPIDRYFVSKDRKREYKRKQNNKVWGRMQEIDSDQESEFCSTSPRERQQVYSPVDRPARRSQRPHPYERPQRYVFRWDKLNEMQKQQRRFETEVADRIANTAAQMVIDQLKEKGIITSPFSADDEIDHEDLARRLLVLKGEQDREEEPASSPARAPTPAGQRNFIFHPPALQLAAPSSGAQHA